MKLYWVKTNLLIRRLFPSYLWKMPGSEKKVYLTFDDGPTPEITDWVLKTLSASDAKATFFCVGRNAERYPEIIDRIKKEGHSLGNHTQNHLNGWATSLADYLSDVAQCQSVFKKALIETKLFRPPYGKLTCRQKKTLLQMGYQIVMWDILSGDFDLTLTPEKITENVTKNINPGSIIIFHDSAKAALHLKHVLPKTIDFLKEKGYQMLPL